MSREGWSGSGNKKEYVVCTSLGGMRSEEILVSDSRGSLVYSYHQNNTGSQACGRPLSAWKFPDPSRPIQDPHTSEQPCTFHARHHPWLSDVQEMRSPPQIRRINQEHRQADSRHRQSLNRMFRKASLITADKTQQSLRLLHLTQRSRPLPHTIYHMDSNLRP